MVNISTTGLTAQSILQIRNAQATLSDLSNQLATGKRSTNFQDYTFTETRRIIDYTTLVDKHESYIGVINTIEPRLKVYEAALTKLSKFSGDALTLVNTTQDYNTASSTALGAQLLGNLSDVTYYLNQKLGDRFLFSGTGARLTTQPVQDLTTLVSPPAAADIVATTPPTLPTYDVAAPGANASAFAHDTVGIDDGYTLNYGVSSNDTGIQNLVLGLRWAYAATQSPANYTTYMATARGLLNTSLPQLRDIQANIAANQNRLNDTKTNHTSLITQLTNQVDDIRHADSAEISAKITFTQSQLEASYSVTARIAQLSITKYL
jgi:flagellar hook-associated protein 3 FlgL